MDRIKEDRKFHIKLEIDANPARPIKMDFRPVLDAGYNLCINQSGKETVLLLSPGMRPQIFDERNSNLKQCTVHLSWGPGQPRNVERDNRTLPPISEIDVDKKSKRRYGLIPIEAPDAIAEVFEWSGQYHEDWDWVDKYTPMQCWESAQRHLWAWKDTGENDHESGLSHIKHALTRLAMLLHIKNRGPKAPE